MNVQRNLPLFMFAGFVLLALLFALTGCGGAEDTATLVVPTMSSNFPGDYAMSTPTSVTPDGFGLGEGVGEGQESGEVTDGVPTPVIPTPLPGELQPLVTTIQVVGKGQLTEQFADGSTMMISILEIVTTFSDGGTVSCKYTEVVMLSRAGIQRTTELFSDCKPLGGLG